MAGENRTSAKKAACISSIGEQHELKNASPLAPRHALKSEVISFRKLFRGDIRALPKRFRERLHYPDNIELPDDEYPIGWCHAGVLSFTMWWSASNGIFWLEITDDAIDGLQHLFLYYSDPFASRADAEAFAAELSGAQWPGPTFPKRAFTRCRVLVSELRYEAYLLLWRFLVRSRRALGRAIDHVQMWLVQCKAAEIAADARGDSPLGQSIVLPEPARSTASLPLWVRQPNCGQNTAGEVTG